MKRIKIYYVLRLVLSAAFGIAVGLGVLWADAYSVEIFDILLIALGVITVGFNLPALVLSVIALLKKKKWEWINVALALVSIAFGVSFMLISRNSPAFMYLLLGYIAVVPFVRILLVDERAKQFRLEIPKILFGVFMIVVTLTKSEDTMFFVLAICVIAISVIYLIKGLLQMPRECVPQEEKNEK